FKKSSIALAVGSGIKLLALNKRFIPSFQDFKYLIENELEFLFNNISKVLLLFNRVAEYCLE
ncbi:hypothetical protein, partial [Morganella morganii]|uniref:hypothetical protein n=1 Tax=Morganella morganii TaxID=582 RepID=UPI0019539999